MNYQGPFTVLDLFCGVGGLSLGFVKMGFPVVMAVDNNDAAVATYAANLGAHVTKLDLAHSAKLPAASVIIGGPPCQGFSSAGLRRAEDPRNSLIAVFARIVAELRPLAFVFENVEGFLTSADGDRIIELLKPLITVGYRVHLQKVNAANYGVPQHRKRVIAIGGLGWSPSFPQPTHAAFGAPGSSLVSIHLPHTPSVRQALQGLPPPGIDPPGIPQGHYYRPLEGVELLRALALKQGQTMRDLPNHLQHESFQRRAFRRVMDGTPSDNRGGAPAGIRRLSADEPAKAITGGAGTEFLHPAEHRPLTLRECARLQTFDDSFIFSGSAAQQAQLIGNAVPPLLAQAIARTVRDDLLRLDRAGAQPGALLSFLPTLSTGASPALQKVCHRVTDTFNGRSEIAQPRLWE